MTEPVIIYDGDCAFCTKSIIRLEAFMKGQMPKKVTLQRVNLQEYGILLAEAQAAMKYVDLSGRVWTGERAFQRVFYDAGGKWRILANFMGLPIIKSASAAIYKKIALNRQKMPGAEASCAIPTKND